MRKHIKAASKCNSSGQANAKRIEATPIIGIDLGDRWSQVCILNSAGSVTKRARVATQPSAFREYFAHFAGARAALETGTHCGWATRALGLCGIDVTVANAREIRKIHQSNRKNDRVDAETLARLLRVDKNLLSPIHLRSAQAQLDLASLRSRDALVRSRTLCINAARGLVKPFGARLPKSSADSFAQRAADHIPQALKTALTPLLQIIAELTGEIRQLDAAIENLAENQYGKTKLLRQVDGVGALTSLAYILTLDDATRFAHSRDVGPYLGLVPRQYDSGDRTSQLPITKAGNCYLRRLLVQSAHYILGPFGPNSRLRRYGERLMERGGKNAKKRAIVAVARKLAILLHHLWTTGAVYRPQLRKAD